MEYMPFDPHYWMSAAKKKEKNQQVESGRRVE